MSFFVLSVWLKEGMAKSDFLLTNIQSFNHNPTAAPNVYVLVKNCHKLGLLACQCSLEKAFSRLNPTHKNATISIRWCPELQEASPVASIFLF